MVEVGISRARLPDKQPAIEQLVFSEGSRYLPREYFILTDAGKPVFISRPGGEDQDGMTSTIGIMQALISVFLDEGDKLRSIGAGRTRITFLLRPPLYYVCVSTWGEPESVARSHLEHLHLQILSIVTASQLKRIFERRTNFDLRRLLNGAETLMHSLLSRLETDLAITMSSLQCLKLEPVLRKKIAEAIVPTSKMKADTLYIILVAKNRVITLLRPRKHSIHPADLHIVLNTIHSPSVVNSLASASWIPVCLPKFNSSNFVNACINFLRKDDESSDTGSDFDLIRTWSESAVDKLVHDGTLAALVNAIQSSKTEYSVSELAVPGLRHFIYKSRTQVQLTVPLFEDPYDQPTARKRIITLYQILHDAIHARSGQESGLKLQYIRTESESVMGWITQPFELYVSLSPLLPKSAVVGAANAVARWVKKEESRLFLRDAPVF
ncbi:vacuolar fusion protein MON1 [Panaeolus papilionaceus]|nr:vacuolar fusion protein MON1 [Panaeolus papilionaceus]